MTQEIYITPEETPAQIDLANAYRNWDKVHPKFLRGEDGVTREDDEKAWQQRKDAEDALVRERSEARD